MAKLRIPVGISDFKRIREENYYIDKSGIIKNTDANKATVDKRVANVQLGNFFQK